MRKLFNSVLAIIAFVGGWAAAAHLHAFQSKPMQSSSHQITPHSTGSHGTGPHGTGPHGTDVRPPAFQLGIDVDAYTYPKQDFPTAVAAVIAYAKTLKANSLSISFPVFMTNKLTTSVYATPRTPSPAEIGLFTSDAVHAGLYVTLRPLLSEFQIGGNRTIWQPVNLSAWFASYQQFLLPYARAAQASKAGMFIVGAEFSKFEQSPLWNQLDLALAKVFHGRLGYSNNGNGNLTKSSGGQYTYKTVDAYPRINPPFLSGWSAWDHALPTGTILSEVGIAAWDGAWTAPWQHRLTQQTFDPQVQANWFTAACQAAKASGLGGIYFWNLGLEDKFPVTSTLHPGAWAYSPGATAIAHCFASAA